LELSWEELIEFPVSEAFIVAQRELNLAENFK
jgi:hypothetical protein